METLISIEDYVRDPYAFFAARRQENPVSRVNLFHLGEVWLITGYQEADAMLKDTRFLRDERTVNGPGSPERSEPLRRAMDVKINDEGTTISDEEIAATCLLMITGGHETTMNLIANGYYLLLSRPDQYERARRDRSIVPNAVEEILRYEPGASTTASARTSPGSRAKSRSTCCCRACGNRRSCRNRNGRTASPCVDSTSS